MYDSFSACASQHLVCTYNLYKYSKLLAIKTKSTIFSFILS